MSWAGLNQLKCPFPSGALNTGNGNNRGSCQSRGHSGNSVGSFGGGSQLQPRAGREEETERGQCARLHFPKPLSFSPWKTKQWSTKHPSPILEPVQVFFGANVAF